MTSAGRSDRPGRPAATVRELPGPDRCLVMGVVNTTPDSFSDGGRHLDPDDAVRHGLDLAARGADLVDVGGESTRPGAQRVPVADELRRVVPVVRRLADAGVVVSVDTTRAEVAARAVEAGARLVNDVSGGWGDEEMFATVAALGVPMVLMHSRGSSAEMDGLARYGHVVREVVAELRERVDGALAAGIAAERLVIDPGIGFAKTAEHNWELLGDLGAVVALGHPVLVGTSRKRFLGALLGTDDQPRPPQERDDATVATTVLAALAGAWCVRVHDAAGSADAVRVVRRWLGGPGAEPDQEPGEEHRR